VTLKAARVNTPKVTRGGEWGRVVPPIATNKRLWRSFVSSPSTVQGRAPAENAFG